MSLNASEVGDVEFQTAEAFKIINCASMDRRDINAGMGWNFSAEILKLQCWHWKYSIGKLDVTSRFPPLLALYTEYTNLLKTEDRRHIG